MRRRARDRGKIAGGIRPYGYRWLDGSLEVVPGERLVVERIFADSIAGASQKAIARALTVEGVASATGKPWLQPSVRNVLMNPLYIGKIRHQGEEYDGTHEAIIDEATFAAAAAVREAQAEKKRTKPNRKGDLRGSPSGSNNGGGRWPKGHHLMVKGLLRCGICGSAMTPRTDPNRRIAPHEVYQCHGRFAYGPEHCSQKPIKREFLDEAILSEITTRFLDVEQTRERLRARLEADRAIAASTLADAEAEALRAAERLSRVVRAFQDGIIEAADYAQQRANLIDEQTAAEAAAERAHSQAETPSLDDIEEETLRRLADLRAAVLSGIDHAPDLNALRTLLRQIFESITYWPATHWGEALVIPGTSAGINVGGNIYAGQAVLIPALKREAIAGYEGDPLETPPTVRKAPLALAGVSDYKAFER